MLGTDYGIRCAIEHRQSKGTGGVAMLVSTRTVPPNTYADQGADVANIHDLRRMWRSLGGTGVMGHR